MKSMKKALAVLLAATLTLGSATAAFAADTASATSAPAVAATKVTDEAKNTVSTKADGTATLTKVGNKTSKKVTVDTVTVNGVEYTVTSIAKQAFKGTKATTVTLGSGVKTISKQAFKSSKVTTVTLSGTKSITIKKGAFTGSKVKTIKVNKKISKKEYNKLVKALKKAGFKGKVKKVSVK